MVLENNFEVIVSVRSSDTNDSFASDLAVPLSTGLMETGSTVTGKKTQSDIKARGRTRDN